MSDSFTSGHVFQAILGAAVYPENRTRLLGKVAEGLQNDRMLDPVFLREGVQKALDVGAITREEVEKYFNGVITGHP
ncbi:MAG: hypothetical protein HQL63_00730 [Magnetococcales bacterium]|nr:hypothetical protein [Magnetococcales bacterium]MBF0323279.1 hypothetical protein [Magnetococcales bacterium]